MNTTNTFRNNPNITTLLLIALILLSLTLSRKCAAQTVPVDKEVLKYLFKESSNAFYLRSDIKLCDSTIVVQDNIISTKDSLIGTCETKSFVKDVQISICEMEVNGLELQKKTLTKEVKKFKLLTYIVTIIGSISTAYFIIH